MRTKIRGKKMYQEMPQIESEPCQIKAVWKPNFWKANTVSKQGNLES